ncbi:DUF2497 domain-containing protein [Devosia sp.]|uniref:PopZ family protein n=1 Tax=Devosia sp. TaxID=1871048 RepID=UPI002AFEDB25|nr:DUF2497 domain-containing protein [Devosia sp.]
MNKPAPKEPSMDEILSSIRQIIADDDAAGAPRRPAIQAAPPPMQAAPARSLGNAADADLSSMLEDIEPLALSPSQIVDKGEDDDAVGFSFDSILADTETGKASAAEAPAMVDPDDISFDIAEPEPEPEEELPAFDPPPMTFSAPEPEPAPQPAPFVEVEPEQEAEPVFAPQASIAEAAPLPDPMLTSDMADQLLEPATRAAVRGSMTRLKGMGIGNPGATIESLMRDMLRPMLKEWLDENLPAVVERLVEKEIARISRGE